MKKILIIEDSKPTAQALSVMFNAIGYNVISAYDSMQAVMYAQREKPDLVILDIMMPAGGGINVAMKLSMSTHTMNIPIIVFTAVDIDEVKNKTGLFNIRYFVEKPDTTLLLEHVKELLGDSK